MLSVGEYQRRKNESGAKANETLESMLEDLKINTNLNISIEKNYVKGYLGMDRQFKMDYCIVFHDFDDKQWLLKSTNSIRDRIYGTEFFAQNIRIIDSHTKQVESIFVVVPDSMPEKEYANAKRYSTKIHSNKYKSFLTDIVTIGELRDLIINKCMTNTPQGIRANIIGKDAESRVAQLLVDENNWHLWNDYESCRHNLKSDTYLLFKKIMTTIGATPCLNDKPSPNSIVKIEATTNIPKLKGGGYPKTDVSFSITFENSNIQTHNITIKKTARKRVSIHEGDVADLIKALSLDPDNQLAHALSAFQKYGSKSKLEESTESYLIAVLDKELPQYNVELVKFALFGVNSPRITDKLQIADCILLLSNSTDSSFWLRDEYMNYYLESFESKGQFGTPFQWTYPSKKRGTRFQLKGFTTN